MNPSWNDLYDTLFLLEAAAVAAMGTATDANFANTDIMVIAVDDGTSTAVFQVSSGADNNAIEADEVQLLAILQNVTADLVAGDFIF